MEKIEQKIFELFLQKSFCFARNCQKWNKLKQSSKIIETVFFQNRFYSVLERILKRKSTKIAQRRNIKNVQTLADLENNCVNVTPYP